MAWGCACRANDGEPRALQQSLGLMATFQYVPQDVERYLHEYRASGKTPVHADIVEQLPPRLYSRDDR